MIKRLGFLFFLAYLALVMVGCAGSPAKISTQTYVQVADENFRGKSKEYICEQWEKYGSLERCKDNIGQYSSVCPKVVKALKYEVSRRGLPPDYCVDPSAAERKLAQEAKQRVFDEQWETETYNIDLLKVTTQSRRQVDFCESGSVHKILLEGQISPDSSFAMSRLLDRLKPCANSTGKTLVPVAVSLRSGGGLLDDGYLMGETFRQRGVTTVIEDGEACASSCAVAFLGGTKRILEGDAIIMYHAPYFTGENVYGKRDIDCEVGEEALANLNAYYRKMTDAETGDRLFERTMWYCSADDGWVVKGASAAELYGIATEK